MIQGPHMRLSICAYGLKGYNVYLPRGNEGHNSSQHPEDFTCLRCSALHLGRPVSCERIASQLRRKPPFCGTGLSECLVPSLDRAAPFEKSIRQAIYGVSWSRSSHKIYQIMSIDPASFLMVSDGLQHKVLAHDCFTKLPQSFGSSGVSRMICGLCNLTIAQIYDVQI